MSGEMWAFLGTAVLALFTLGGVIYNARQRQPGEMVTALVATVKSLGEENGRLREEQLNHDKRFESLETELANCKSEFEKKLGENQTQIEKLYSAVGHLHLESGGNLPGVEASIPALPGKE